MAFLTQAANRGSISTGYEVGNSCKFEHDNGESLYKDQVQGTQTTWTFSTWLKRTALSDSSHSYHHVWAAGSGSSDNGTKFYFRGDSSYPENRIFFYMDNGGTQYLHGATSQSFRDTSAWYHIVWAVDTTQSTASDRSKVYINGELQTLVGVPGAAFTNPPQNSSTRVNDNGGVMYVGAQNQNGGNRFRGYLAETVLIDGSQLDVTDFGEFDSDTGIWIPKDVSGLSFGTRGFYLDYSDASNLGNDADGSTEFTESNISADDQATDTPTNNFCTFNPLQTITGKWVVSNGATSVIQGADYGYLTHAGNMGFKKGKWYAEFKAGTGTVQAGVGMNQLDNTVAWENSYIGAYTNSTAVGMCKSEDGYFYRNGGSGALGVTWAAGDILGIAVVINADGTGFLGMSKNGTWENSQDPSSGISGMLGLYYGNPLPDDLFHSFAIFTRRNNGPMLANFGGYPGFTISSGNSDANGYGTFEYAPPSGYYALCSKNLAEFG